MFAGPLSGAAIFLAKKHNEQAFNASPSGYKTRQYVVLATAFTILHNTS
jgi:hypothetical protein